MNRRLKPWLFAGGVLTVFLLFAWQVPGVSGTVRTILRIVLISLGVLAAGIVYLLVRARTRAAPAVEPEGREIDLTLAAARQRLAAAKGKAGSAFGRLPVILFAGPVGGAKTTVISRSGMEPELLAGEERRNGEVVPTDPVNVWYAQDHLILEAGGQMLDDAGRWRRLIRHVQPKRLAAILSRGEQAPRLAVVCYPCDELVKPGSADAVTAAAQRIRARLAEVSQQIGIRLPVYVLFTKADQLPYFADAVRNLAREETQDVIGATLPLEPASPAGTYAERQSRRLTAAFRDVVRSLARRRTELLGRETEEIHRAGAYEFAREFQKVSDAAVQFLLDLCRPSQLGVTPFLRGFYFTGARAVVVTDAAPLAMPSRPASEEPPGATGVFSMRELRAAHPAPLPGVSSRRVWEWVFLDRLFRDVILRDAAARQVTAGGTRVDFIRRAALATAAAALIVLCVGMTSSFFFNLNLQQRSAEALRGAVNLTETGEFLTNLRNLDGLRRQDSLLAYYEHVRKPLRLRWGLYSGTDLHQVLRRFYFLQPFENLVWRGTRNHLIGELRGFTGDPDAADAYDDAYGALKAYLLTTDYSDSAALDLDFLPRVLSRYWPRAGEAEEADSLGRMQFRFFASALPYGNPYPDTADPSLVRSTQEYMKRFTDDEQLYGAFVSRLSQQASPVAHSEMYVRTGVVIPGAYTREGWFRTRETLDNLEDLFTREPWVTGEPFVPTENRDSIKGAILDRYTADYVQRWIEFLETAEVDRFSAADAPAELSVLQGPSSPLLGLLSKVSNNTDVADSASEIYRTFAPVHKAVPSGMTNTFLSTANEPYLGALGALSTALRQMALDPAGSDDQARSAAGLVLAQAQAVPSAQSNAPRAAEVAGLVRELLERPARYAEQVLRGHPAAQINEKSADFCRPFERIRQRFPFNPDTTAPDVAVEELNTLLAAGEGTLWSFRRANLQDLIDSRGEPIPGADPSATAAFAAFFRQLARLSSALYGQTRADPQLYLNLAPLPDASAPEIIVDIDGRPTRTTQNARASRDITWTGIGHNSARISVVVDGGERLVAQATGPFAVLRLLHRAQWTRAGRGVNTLSWAIPGSAGELRATLTMQPEAGVFVAAHQERLLSCPARIVQ